MSRRERVRRTRSEQWLPVPATERPPADQMTDVVVIGSDPGALAAAIACRQAGWEVLVVEAAGTLGGRAAPGAGQLWLPGHPGLPDDDYASVRDYFDRVVQRFDAATNGPRRHGFLTGCAQLVGWLGALGIGLVPDGAGDHYPALPGGRATGRVLVPQPTDITDIGRLAEFVPAGERSIGDGLVDRLEHGARMLEGAARGKRLAHGGAGLVGGLLAACQRLQVNIWWDAPVTDLVVGRDESGQAERVNGVVVRRGGRSVRVFAGRGVVIAEGGFEADAPARRAYLPRPSRPVWTLGPARADGVLLAQWAAELELEMAGMGDAWWRPGLWQPEEGLLSDAQAALASPHGFLVDATGRRFCNEAAPGNDICRAIYARVRELGPETIPVWLVVDSGHPLGSRHARRSGGAESARSLPELAWQIKVDAVGLQATADRFEALVAAGVDDDFARPAESLGQVGHGQFHALRVVPADRGTKGGLVTDEWGRALRAAGALALGGLYAIGSAAASVTGADDPAPGVGLAEAMVFGRRTAVAITEDAE